LHLGGDGRGITQGEWRTLVLAQRAHYDDARVNAHPNRQPHTSGARGESVELRHAFHQAQSGMHGAPCIVFMGPRIAKIYDQPIPLVLRDIPVKSVHGLSP
jgi:hypothetical protein